MTPPTACRRDALGAIGYRKPAAVLLALRNHVVGRAAFDQAFREYARRWAFKHPTPADFFRRSRASTGEDLVVVLARLLLHERRARHRDRQRLDDLERWAEHRDDSASAAHVDPVPGGDAAQARRRLDAGSSSSPSRSGTWATATRRRSRCAHHSPACACGPTVPFPISTRPTIRGGVRRPKTRWDL